MVLTKTNPQMRFSTLAQLVYSAKPTALFCVLFFLLASPTPEVYCIQAKFMGLKIDKIASKDQKSSSQIQAVTSDHLDDLLQHQHFTDCGQEELSINFDYDNTE